VGWLPSAVFKAAKVFVLYLARWIGAAPAH
jgi:hypothetical protein